MQPSVDTFQARLYSLQPQKMLLLGHKFPTGGHENDIGGKKPLSCRNDSSANGIISVGCAV